MIALWSFLLLLLVAVRAITGQAPGDEDGVCLQDVFNEEDLMSSLNYRDLVPSRGGPWAVVNNDDNNDGFTSISVTAVSEIHCESLFVLNLILVDTSSANLYKDCWCMWIYIWFTRQLADHSIHQQHNETRCHIY